MHIIVCFKVSGFPRGCRMPGIREEMQRQAKQQQIAQEVQNRMIAANTNPRTEIIRELQTIVQPTVPLPQAPA